MIWNWDNIQHRAEYPEPSALVFGHPEVWEDGKRLDLLPSPFASCEMSWGWDSETRVRELGR